MTIDQPTPPAEPDPTTPPDEPSAPTPSEPIPFVDGDADDIGPQEVL
jgi:hypothetical protein